jgi:regulation of enolase protein 1 (concanavalin A-like superfamily)
MKKGIFIVCMLITMSKLYAQNMETMQWFNEPQTWKAEQKSLSMFVTPKTDYWRITHYGFTVDDGPFYYSTQGGEFEAKVKITGEYKSRYDQMGLMLRIDETTWIKTGIEYVDGIMNVSAVVTNEKSDWSVLQLTGKPKSIWVKAVRRLDAVEISYSLDDKEYKMFRLAYFPAMKPVMVGMVAASPDGDGFNALFEGFEIKHLPDSNRLKWLENNK